MQVECAATYSSGASSSPTLVKRTIISKRPIVNTYSYSTPSAVVVHASPGYYGYTTYVSGGTQVSAKTAWIIVGSIFAFILLIVIIQACCGSRRVADEEVIIEEIYEPH